MLQSSPVEWVKFRLAAGGGEDALAAIDGCIDG
jgi:hypothetical protein